VADLPGGVEEHHRRGRLTPLGLLPHELRAIRERATDASLDVFKKGPGRPKRDSDVIELEAELHRTSTGPDFLGHPLSGHDDGPGRR